MAYIFITTKEKTNWKYILIIVILALIVIGESFLLLKQEVSVPLPKPIPPKQTQDETANWKTYRNEEYGFEIKYPPDYNLTLVGPNEEQRRIERGEQISGTIPPSFDTIIFEGVDNERFSIEIYYPPYRELNQDYGFAGQCGSQFFDETLINRLISINAKKFLERRQLYKENKIRIDYCFVSGTNNLITLRATNLDPAEVDKIDKLLHQMLSTFTLY